MPNVTVGCKLPHGLIIRLNSNSKTQVTLNGANSGTVVGLDGKVQRGTCGFTQVDETFINAWLKAYADTVMVKKGLIFISKNQKEAQAQADDKENIKTGFEPTDPAKPAAPGVTPAEQPEA